MPETSRTRGRRANYSGEQINQGDHMVSTWHEDAVGDNAVATASHAAETGKKHYLSNIIASFSGSAVAELRIKEAGTTILSFDVHDEIAVALPHPLEFGRGNALSVELDASGTGGNVGKVNLIGYTA